MNIYSLYYSVDEYLIIALIYICTIDIHRLHLYKHLIESMSIYYQHNL